jgi:hypothetical protein
VDMQGRSLKGLCLAFENGKRAASIAARNLNRHVVAKHMDRPAIAALHEQSVSTRIRGNKHPVSLLDKSTRAG